MKLNGWHRIGVVLSVLWALVAFFWTRNTQVKNAEKLFNLQYGSCLDQTNFGNCDHISLQSAMDTTANWSDVAFFSLAPVLLAWLLGLLSVKVFKWIKMGFEKSP